MQTRTFGAETSVAVAEAEPLKPGEGCQRCWWRLPAVGLILTRRLCSCMFVQVCMNTLSIVCFLCDSLSAASKVLHIFKFATGCSWKKYKKIEVIGVLAVKA